MKKHTCFDDIAAGSDSQPLSGDEINDFFDDIDQDRDGWITMDDLRAKLEIVHNELAPARKAKNHHRHRISREYRVAWTSEEDVERRVCRAYREYTGTREFLRTVMPGIENGIGKQEFASVVNAWKVPSQRQSAGGQSQGRENGQRRSWTRYRTLRAHWSVEGPRMVFLLLVFCMILVFSLWQGISLNDNAPVRAALGPGVVVAKFAAGALYPVITIMLLSMSRWLSTWFRRSYWISRFVDWDHHKSFHIWIAWIGLSFATLHGISHLTGSFLTGSRPSRRPGLVELTEPDLKLSTYATFLRKLPGWSGLLALGLYWIIALLASPQVRQWSYELFQAAHLLMFPLLGLLCAHGTTKLIQAPMLGFWLLIPIMLLAAERCCRVMRGFIALSATMEILDDDTVAILVKHPKHEYWHCQAGQYILLQVPKISFWQWHPFTISACRKDQLQLHIKTDGDWTGRLRYLPTDTSIRVGLDGPFGAPAQRFYDFDRAIIIGTGVGVTPFSAIVADVEQHLSELRDPWESQGRPSLMSLRSVRSSLAKQDNLDDLCYHREADIHCGISGPMRSIRDRAITATRGRRVDFHWSVREEGHLLWFSSLLNRAHDLASLLPRGDLELNINTHITAQRTLISTHIFRYLLDAYRTSTSPFSALTGLKTRSHFGRPDYKKILEEFYREEIGKTGPSRCRACVGVFFCGNPQVGRILSETCAELNVRARADGSKMDFVFKMEVFG